MEDIKKKHHFVFQAYIEQWADQVDNAVWVLMNKRKLFITGTEGIAFKKCFYSIKELNEDEHRFLICFIDKMNADTREQLYEFTNAYFHVINNMKTIESLKQAALDTFGCKKNIPLTTQKDFKKLENILTAQINNTIEDIYCDVEGELITYIRKIENHGIDFYYHLSDEDKFNFLWNICIQYFRTTNLKERWVKRFGDQIKTLDTSNLGFDIKNVNLNNVAFFLFWYIQYLVAFALTKENTKVILLINNTSISFITSDQPIINLKCDYDNDLASTTELEFFYPLSPYKALLINRNIPEKQLEISENDVIAYNNKIAKVSKQFLISNNEEILKDFIK